MKFKEWVEKEWKGSKAELSRRLGISYSHLHRLLKGERKKPTLPLALKIEEVSKGKVKVKDWV